MNLLKLLRQKSRFFYVAIIFLAIVKSIANIGILMVINEAIGGKQTIGFGNKNYLIFSILVVTSLVVTWLFQNYMIRSSNDMMFELEVSMIQKVRNATFECFEKLGSQHLYAAIADARSLGNVPATFVTLFNAFFTLLCSLIYLFSISLKGGVFVFLLMAVLFLIYVSRAKAIERDLNKARDLQDSYYVALYDLLQGFKQIKISALRNNNLFNDYILFNRQKARKLNIGASQKYLFNELTGVYSWYVLLGIVIFVLPIVLNIGVTQVAAFVVSVLFMIAPISQLVLFFPLYTMYKISIERITRINSQLETEAIPVEGLKCDVCDFQSMRFEQVSFKYSGCENNLFTLKVPELTIKKGEIIFIIGGNGSGKTTFIHLLTGLFRPQSGKIYVNDQEMEAEAFIRFTNNMAAVFSDHYLFNENLDGFDISENNALVVELAKLVNLDGVLKYDEVYHKLETRLSKGQRKRLALLLALLEGKPIVVLDEWAAEQDPPNRRQFYQQWLEVMRKMGKTIIAVTHDDDFYHVADRVLKFNYGNLERDFRVVREVIYDGYEES